MSNTNYTKALSLFHTHQYGEALEFFNLALEAEPDHVDALSDRAVCYFHLQKFELALIDLNLAAKLQPEYGYRYSSRAYVKERMGDLEGAIADYETAVKLDPEDAISYNNLGMIQEKLGHRDLANQFYKRSNLLAGIDENKGLTKENKQEEKQQSPAEALPQIPEKRETKVSRKMWDIITNPSEWRELWKFIINGFKIK